MGHRRPLSNRHLPLGSHFFLLFFAPVYWLSFLPTQPFWMWASSSSLIKGVSKRIAWLERARKGHRQPLSNRHLSSGCLFFLQFFPPVYWLSFLPPQPFWTWKSSSSFPQGVLKRIAWVEQARMCHMWAIYTRLVTYHHVVDFFFCARTWSGVDFLTHPAVLYATKLGRLSPRGIWSNHSSGTSTDGPQAAIEAIAGSNHGFGVHSIWVFFLWFAGERG